MNGLITLQELEGISDEEMETIYALGHNFFTYGKYDAAGYFHRFNGLRAIHGPLLESARGGQSAAQRTSRKPLPLTIWRLPTMTWML